jgi:hypothetical protein
MDYYIYKNDENIGPLSESEVVGGLKGGRFSPSDLSCRVGESEWKELSFFFPDISHSWMDDSSSKKNAASSSTRSAPTGFDPEFNRQPNIQYPIQANSQPSQVQHVVHHFEEKPETTLPKIALTGGIVVASLMVLGLIPCLGWLNWFVILLALVMKAVCWVAIFTEKNTKGRNKALIGLVLVVLALVIGGIRLAIGGGCV